MATRPLIYGSACSGIEAATVAWHPLGWKPAFFSEIDRFPSSVLKHRYPDVSNACELTTNKDGDYDPIDLLVGGTPCQAFSVAGLRGGLADERGNLTLEFLRLAERLRPRWLVWENVPGVFSATSHVVTHYGELREGYDEQGERIYRQHNQADEAHAFSCFLAGLQELGYGFAYRVLDAQHFGVPQRRRRVFVVGHLGDWRRAAAVLFERHSLSGYPPPSRQARQNIAYDIAPCIGASGRGFERTGDTRGQDCVVPVHADMRLRESRAGGERCDSTLFGGVSDSQSDAEATSRMSASSHPRRSGAFASTGDIAHCLNAGAMGRIDYETETMVVSPLVGHPYADNESAESKLIVTRPLRGDGFDASEDGTGRGTPLEPVAVAHLDILPTMQNGADTPAAHSARSGHTKDAYVVPVAFRAAGQDEFTPSSISPPIAESDGGGSGVPTIAFDTTQITSKTCRSQPADGKPCHSLSSQGHPPANFGGMRVRRLTPRECERLQGFPDDYTKVNSKTKDGPRYKALGNSMAVPVMRWIAERIAAVERASEGESPNE